MEDWQRRIIERDGPAREYEDWQKRIIERDGDATNVLGIAGPDAGNIDYSEEAPKMVRLEVGALDKPEDRLRTIRKHYPDAQPYGDDNFIYTDESGKTRLYNHESWFPSLGDIVSIAPEIGETIGGGIGAFGGAIGGAAVGSAVPVVGTAAGGVSGAIGGAGTGSVAGREAIQRGVNYLFGNDDTRTGKEQALDAAQTFALGAAGEGAGRLLGAGVRAGKNAFNRRVIGEMDDAAEAAARAARYRAIGVEPTVGMATGAERASGLEHALIPTRSGKLIQDRNADAFGKQGDEFTRIVNGLSDANPIPTIAEAGETLQTMLSKAKDAGFKRSGDLYDDVARKVTGPAVIDNTAKLLDNLNAEKAAFGEFDKLTRGAATDNVIAQATAIVTDAKNGMSFDKLKEARSAIGQMASGTDDKILKNRLNDLYRSLTDDMQATAYASGDEAKQAFNKANNHYRRLVDPEKGFGKGSVADKLLEKNSDEVFNYAFQQRKNGGNRIAQIRRTVEKAEGGKEAWNQVAAGFTERLGMTSVDGDQFFNPTQFLNKWSKDISDEAKDAIFKGTSNGQYRRDLDRLARIAADWKKYRSYANHSNTANHQALRDSMNPLSKDNMLASALGITAAVASGGSAATGLAAGAAKGAITKGTGGLVAGSRVKFLTDPKTVNWIANIPAAEMRKGGMRAHIRALIDVGKNTADNALATAINDYLRDIGYKEEQ